MQSLVIICYNISENTYFTILILYIYIYFTILFYISYSILYICIKLKVECIDPHLKTMLITLSGS